MSGSLLDTSGRVWSSPGPRENAALLVVDVQRDFTDPALLPWLDTADQERITAAVERVNALVAAARAMEVRVIWVRLTQDPDRPWGSSRWLRGLLDACEDTLREQEPCLAGTPGADWYRVAPAPGEEVVVKRRYSAFHDTTLEASLRESGTTWLVVCGMTTDCCVDATVRDGFQRGLRTVVAADATASHSLELHRHTLSALSLHAAVVADSDAVAKAWSGRRLERLPGG